MSCIIGRCPAYYLTRVKGYEEVIGDPGPQERFRILIIDVEIVGDRCPASRSASVSASADLLFGEQSELALHGIEPASAGWREVQAEAEMAGRPLRMMDTCPGGIGQVYSRSPDWAPECPLLDPVRTLAFRPPARTSLHLA